jgi:O-antigen ligase
MQQNSSDINANIGRVVSFDSNRVEWGIIFPIFLILLLCVLPFRGPTLNLGKIFIGIGLFLLTLPGLLAAIVNKVRISGRLILLGFLVACMLNIFNALAYHLSMGKWFRLGFGTYIFVAMVFFVAYKANTITRRYQLWFLLVIFLSFSSYLDFFLLAKYGLAEVYQDRMAGYHPGPMVAMMILFPILGNVLAKKKWLILFFCSNLFLLILTSSRGTYITVAVAAIYTFIFIQKKFSYRLLFLFLIIILGSVIIVTPIYHRMTKRYISATTGQDASLLGRFDEARDAVKEAAKTWPTLLIGKGFGSPYKVDYLLAGPGKEAQTAKGYNIEAPHNDYAARFLYCGLFGLIMQLFIYFVLPLKIIRAIKSFSVIETDIYTQARLHGAFLVMLSMVLAGFAGGVMYDFGNSVYFACVIGMGLADAEMLRLRQVLTTTKTSGQQPQLTTSYRNFSTNDQDKRY